jgi:hypothetical protein
VKLSQGATPAQAKAALARYKDVMQAAEAVFSGAFDDADNCEESGSRRAATTVRPIVRPPLAFHCLWLIITEDARG